MQFDLVTLLILALAPGLFWLWYFYHRDRYAHEPLYWIIWIFLLGMTITVPVAILEDLVGAALPDPYLAVFAAPVIEELAKFLVVWRTVFRTQDFDEPVDGMVYATAAGLGFATLENVGYIFLSYESSFPDALGTGVLRALLSVPAHALFSAIWGYALGMARFSPPDAGRRLILQGLVAAMVFHGLFNLLLLDYAGIAVLVLFLIPLLWWLVNRDFSRALGRFR
ncbi:MAG: PrsW family glutamic-type intramembrane protease [Methanoregulaceae archaeon]|nr:PrsW family glutamic-type intramembrane protease [Methanoregulaceae archaeon]